MPTLGDLAKATIARFQADPESVNRFTVHDALKMMLYGRSRVEDLWRMLEAGKPLPAPPGPPVPLRLNGQLLGPEDAEPVSEVVPTRPRTSEPTPSPSTVRPPTVDPALADLGPEDAYEEDPPGIQAIKRVTQSDVIAILRARAAEREQRERRARR